MLDNQEQKHNSYHLEDKFKILPEFSRVTDREVEESLHLIGMEREDFFKGQRVLISGSGFHF